MSPQETDRLHRFWALLRAWPRSALTLWRRSLRARVVTAIVVLSAVVVGSVGFMVMRQITDGLVKSRVDASVAEARTETSTARERLGSAGGNDFDPETQLRLLVETLVARGEVKGFEVVVRRPRRRGQHQRRRTHHAGGRRRQRPGQPAQDRGEAARTDSPGPTRGSATPTSPRTTATSRAWPSGRRSCCPSDGGTYALYYLFPMGEEQQTLLLLRRVLLTAGDPAAAPRGGSRLPGHPPGDQPRAARSPGRRADRVGTARGADARRG